MVPMMSDQCHIDATSLAEASFTLRGMLEHEVDRRRQSALRRLEPIFDRSLDRLAADIDWFDAQFPSSGLDGARGHP